MAGVSMKDIKSRIRSMESTKQITKAMEMVAASKLRGAQDRAVTAKCKDKIRCFLIDRREFVRDHGKQRSIHAAGIPQRKCLFQPG